MSQGGSDFNATADESSAIPPTRTPPLGELGRQHLARLQEAQDALYRRVLNEAFWPELRRCVELANTTASIVREGL